MRIRTYCALALILMFAVSVFPVSAKSSVDYRANGKLEVYGVVQPGAEVINGHWRVKVKDGKVDFAAYYRERNLDQAIEQSPVGTIDEFWIYLTNLDSVDIDQSTGECTIKGTFYVKKKWWILPDNPDYPYPPPIVWKDPLWTGYGEVTIDSSECILWFWAEVQGPTLSIEY